jgi:hypothetical protein
MSDVKQMTVPVLAAVSMLASNLTITDIKVNRTPKY